MSGCFPHLAYLLRTVAEFTPPLAAAFCPPRILVTQFASPGMLVDDRDIKYSWTWRIGLGQGV